jgi:hypothetical protein
MASDYWKRWGMSLGLTWGLNLKLGDAPAKGSVLNFDSGLKTDYENTSTLPLIFLI